VEEELRVEPAALGRENASVAVVEAAQPELLTFSMRRIFQLEQFQSLLVLVVLVVPVDRVETDRQALREGIRRSELGFWLAEAEAEKVERSSLLVREAVVVVPAVLGRLDREQPMLLGVFLAARL